MENRSKEDEFALWTVFAIYFFMGVSFSAMWMTKTDTYEAGKAIEARIAECQKHTQAGEWCSARVLPRKTPGITDSF